MANCCRYSGGLAVHVRAAVDKQEEILAVGHEGGQGGTVDAVDAAQAEHAARQHSAGGTGRYEAVGLAVAHGQHAFDDRAVLLCAHGHHRRVMVGDDLAAVLDGQPVLHVARVGQQGADILLVAR